MKIQLKRSAVATDGVAKQPDIGQMEFGELAVNYNSGDPAIFLKDNAQNIIRIAGAGNINAGDNPSGPQLPDSGQDVGDVFFNTTNNKLYFWDGTAWVPIATDVTAADIFVGTLDEIDLEVPEATRRNGFLWWNVEDGSLYIWYIDENTSQFVIAIPASGSGGASVAVLDTPPTGPNDGDLWWNTVDGRLYIWYQETVDNGQWVDSSPDSQTSPITSGETFPADALENDCFFNTTDGRLYIYYNDGDEKQWVDASPDSQGAVYWNRIDGTLIPTSNTNDVSIGDGNIELKADGSITAAGSATFAGEIVTGVRDSQGVFMTPTGAAESWVSNSKVWSLGSNGSGTFDGRVQTDEWFQSDRTDANSYFLLGNQSGTEKVSIKSDGSITATGSVRVNRANGSTSDGFSVYSGNKKRVGIDAAGDIKLGDDLITDNTIYLKGSDGSTSFAGEMNIGDIYTGDGTRILPNGEVYIRSDNSSKGVFNVNSGSISGADSTILFTANGSATFAGNLALDFSAGTTGECFRIKSGSNRNVFINGDGSASFSGTVTATVVPPSDARFKENITAAKPQLADVVALGGLLKNYDWTDEAPLNEDLRSVRQLGLIAQEVAEVCPSIVKDINRTKTMEVTPAVTGPKGKVITEAVTQEVDDSYKGLSQEALIMKLIGAVAELSAEVQLLKEGN